MIRYRSILRTGVRIPRRDRERHAAWCDGDPAEALIRAPALLETRIELPVPAPTHQVPCPTPLDAPLWRLTRPRPVLLQRSLSSVQQNSGWARRG